MSSTPGDRRARRQAAREARKAAEPPRSSTPRWLVPGLIVAAIAVAGILAIVLPGSNPPSSGGTSSVRPSVSGPASGAPDGSPGSTASSGSVGAVQEPTITGTPLPALPRDGADPAVGLAVPAVQGTDFTGKPVAISADGRPKVLLFLAHWCPHCQAEVPVIQAWVNGGGLPEGVDLISVATGIDPNAPNYPPDAWLQREGWTSPVLVDPTNTVAQAYGLPAYPYFVFVGPDGKVVARTIGAPKDLDAAVAQLTGS